jgi:HlyD family secretion protein
VSDLGSQEQQTNFEVDVMLESPPPSLRPGMTADVEIRTGTRTGVLHVPIQAVVVRTQEELDRADRKTKAKRAKAARAAALSDTTEGKKTEEIKGVFVMEKGTARFRRVRTGIASDTDFEITGDVRTGEKVITGPYRILRSLKPGQKVKVEEPKGKEAEKR